MTYREQYYEIINFRKQNPLPENEYGELHHITPKSLGGSNTKENLVRLSAAEHYKVHCILPFMYEEEGNKNAYIKMLSAWIRLANSPQRSNPDLSFVDREAAEYEELRKRYVEARKGKKYSDEARRKISALHLGMHFFNNGIINVLAKECPKGFVSRRLGEVSEETRRKRSAAIKGMRFFNNGIKSVRAYECPGPDFVPGRLKLKKSLENDYLDSL